MSQPSSQNSTTVRVKTELRLARAALQTAYVLSEDLGTALAERMFISPRRHVRPPRERAVLAAARQFEIEVPLRSPRWHGRRTSIAAWRWGIGPTVVLVHGWEGRGSQLGSLVEPLVAAGMSVVTYDAPGHGDSPGKQHYLTDAADALAAVVAAVGTVHALIAHSFGCAAVVLAYARDGVDASRNVMLAPNVLVEDIFAKFSRTLGLDDADIAELIDQLALHSGLPLHDLSIERLVGTRDAGLLVVHDRDDREVALVHGERLAAAWPQAQLVVTDGLGHRRILRDPATIARVVAYASAGVPRPTSDLVREVDRALYG
jgi:pimeloyl-ACP methyl ester carboxylesterase